MDQPNPYAPPTARVDDITEADWRANTPPPFFAVSLPKLVVMSVFTFGLYDLYWFYQNWDRIRARERSDIMPLMRAIFAVFFCYQCFARVRDFEHHPDVTPSRLAAGWLAAGWILLTILWRLPDPWWLICFLAVLFKLPVQRRANEINAAVDPGHIRNDRFSVLNWICIVVVGSFLLLAIAGLFMPDEVAALE